MTIHHVQTIWISGRRVNPGGNLCWIGVLSLLLAVLRVIALTILNHTYIYHDTGTCVQYKKDEVAREEERAHLCVQKSERKKSELMQGYLLVNFFSFVIHFNIWYQIMQLWWLSCVNHFHSCSFIGFTWSLEVKYVCLNIGKCTWNELMLQVPKCRWI